MISASGISVRMMYSMRNWSLPLPVQPCPNAFAPSSFAFSTAFRAISGRAMLVEIGIALIVAVGAHGGPAEMLDEHLFGVHRVVFGARAHGALLRLLDIFGGLPDIDRHRDDMVEAVLFPHQRDADGSVQSAGIDQNDLLHLSLIFPSVYCVDPHSEPEHQGEQRFLRVQPVFGLIQDDGLVGVHHFGRDLFARGAQAGSAGRWHPALACASSSALIW